MERPTEITAEVRPWAARPAVMMPVLAVLSLVGGQFPSFSLSANLYVLMTGGALVWLGVTQRVPRRAAPAELGPAAKWWLLPVLFLAAVELVNFGLGSTHDHPTLSLLADPALDDELVRSAVYFAWLTAFWGLIKR
jgi:hypothetical protein